MSKWLNEQDIQAESENCTVCNDDRVVMYGNGWGAGDHNALAKDALGCIREI